MAESEYTGATAGDTPASAPDYDVAIVGASIAGCTAATFLARSGAKVALLESHSDPKTYKRMCTHLIQSSASPTIERLGLRGAIEDAGAQPNDLNIWTRFGWISAEHESAPPPICDHPAWNIRRETFDPMLRELAAATEGVELMLGHTVTALLRDGLDAGHSARAGAGGAGARDGVGAASADERIAGVVVRERDRSERELRARVVLAADGRDSAIAKLADQPTELKPNQRFGYFAHYRDTPLVTGSSAQLWLLDPDVAYAFPTDGGLTLLACLPHKDRLPEYRDDPERAMVRLFDGPARRSPPRSRQARVEGDGQARLPERRPPAVASGAGIHRGRRARGRPVVGRRLRLGAAVRGVARRERRTRAEGRRGHDRPRAHGVRGPASQGARRAREVLLRLLEREAVQPAAKSCSSAPPRAMR